MEQGIPINFLNSERNSLKAKKWLLCTFFIACLLIKTYFSIASSGQKNTKLEVNKVNQDTEIQEMIPFLDNDVWVGRWKSRRNNFQSNSFIDGKCRLVWEQVIEKNKFYSKLNIQLIEGDFIDNGQFSISTVVNSSELAVEKIDEILTIKSLAHHIAQSQNKYLLKTAKEADHKIQLHFSLNQEKEDLSLMMTFMDEQEGKVIEASFKKEGWEVKMGKFFSGLLFLALSGCSLFGVSASLKKIVENQEKYQNFSFCLMLINFFWDLALLGLCVELCIQNKKFFMFSAFLSVPFYCQSSFFGLYFLLQIFKTKNKGQQSQWKINIMFWVIFILTFFIAYQVLIFTNLNNIFFLLLPFFITLQLHNYAIRNKPLELLNPFNFFIFPRLLFILYLRFSPWNIFNLEPHYIFSLLYIILILLFVAFLKVQVSLGPRSIFPHYFLPPTLKVISLEQVGLQERLNIGDCAICLNPLDQPSSNKQRLLEAPCRHRYHEGCIRTWMKIKDECPQCRKIMPSPP